MKMCLMILCLLVFSLQPVWGGEDQMVILSGKTLSKTPSFEVFSNLEYIKQDKWGNVFAVDLKKSRVAKFDKNLNFVTTFGREGKGPGEFSSSPILKKDILQIMDNGDVWIADSNPGRFVIYSNDGKPKKEIRLIDVQPPDLKYNISWHRALTDGVFSAISSKNFTNNILEDASEEFLLLQIQPPKLLFRADINEKTIKMEYKNGWWAIGVKDDSFGDSAKVISDGKLIGIMFSQRYEIILYHEKTGKTVVIKKETHPRDFSDKELSLLKKKYEKDYIKAPGMADALMAYLRSRKNVLMDVQFSNRNILVFPVQDDITVQNKFPADVWDSNGIFLKRVCFPLRPVHIYDNWIYTEDRNDVDDPVIIRHQMNLN